MLTASLLLAAGLAILLGGGEILVRGAIDIARRLEIPPAVIGLTVVAMGTSAPEFVVSIVAVLQGSSGVAVGTVVGSNVANVLVVLGVPAILYAGSRPARVPVRDVDVMVAAGFAFLLFAADGRIERWQGGVLLALLAAYLAASWWGVRRGERRPLDPDLRDGTMGLAAAAALVTGGVVALWAGSRILVPAAVALAEGLGVPNTVVGVVLEALGTSAPELATTLVAARRGEAELALGNVVGSNLFNILGVLGLTALLAPVAVATEVLRFDVWVMIAASLVLVHYALRQRSVGRRAGIAFLALYAAYVVAELAGVASYIPVGLPL